MDFPTIYSGRDYSGVIWRGISRARNRYEWPESNVEVGMKKLLGCDYLTKLLEDEFCVMKIPFELKIKLLGEKRYRERCK